MLLESLGSPWSVAVMFAVKAVLLLSSPFLESSATSREDDNLNKKKKHYPANMRTRKRKKECDSNIIVR